MLELLILPSSCVIKDATSTGTTTELKIIPIYYNFGHTFIILAIISCSYQNILLTKLVAEIWDHGLIAIVKSSQTIKQVTIKSSAKLLQPVYLKVSTTNINNIHHWTGKLSM